MFESTGAKTEKAYCLCKLHVLVTGKAAEAARATLATASTNIVLAILLGTRT